MHTPGPWEIRPHNDAEIRDARWIFAKSGLVCKDVYGDSLDQSDANARLIAAAPDLLAALQDTVESLDYAAKVLHAPEKSKFRENVANARAAIAKATQT